MRKQDEIDNLEACLYVAKNQRGVILSFVFVIPFLFLSLGAVFFLYLWLDKTFSWGVENLSREAIRTHLLLLFMLLSFLSRLPLIFFCFRLYSFFDRLGRGIVYFILMVLLSAVELLGIVSFFVFLLSPLFRASRMLREHGVKVGLFGASLRRIKQRLKDLEMEQSFSSHDFTKTEQTKWSELMEDAQRGTLRDTVLQSTWDKQKP